MKKYLNLMMRTFLGAVRVTTQVSKKSRLNAMSKFHVIVLMALQLILFGCGTPYNRRMIITRLPEAPQNVTKLDMHVGIVIKQRNQEMQVEYSEPDPLGLKVFRDVVLQPYPALLNLIENNLKYLFEKVSLIPEEEINSLEFPP